MTVSMTTSFGYPPRHCSTMVLVRVVESMEDRAWCRSSGDNLACANLIKMFWAVVASKRLT